MAESVLGGLKWVKGEIAATLKRVRDLVETYGASGDPAGLSDAVDALFEVRGVLLALQLTLPARLVEEMQRLTDAMINSSIPDASGAAEALMLALIQLPNHLDRLDAGQEVPPANLWASINDLRESRGAPPVSQTELLVPASVLAESEDVISEEDLEALSAVVRKVRPHFHRHLVTFYRPETSAEGLAKLARLFHQLQRYIKEGVVADLFRLAEVYAEGIGESAVASDATARSLLGHLDRIFKPLLMTPPEWPAQDAVQLIGQLLTVLADSQVESPAVSELQAQYGQTAAAQAPVRGSPDAVAGLASSMLAEIDAIKAQLDLFVRGERDDRTPLEEIRTTLQTLVRTSEVASLGQLPARLTDLADGFAELASADADEDVERLEQLATGLLSVESTLRAYAESRPEPEEQAADTGMSMAELRNATLLEVRGELSRVKDAIVACDAPGARPASFGAVPNGLTRIAGALQILGDKAAADLSDNLASLLQRRYLVPERWPREAELERLADTLAALELHLEQQAEGGTPYGEDLIDRADKSLEALDALLAAGLRAVPSPPTAEAQERAPERAARPEAVRISPEFLEIFLEEARDEIETVRSQLAIWQDHLDNEDALAILRRSFHTLKGSGRLVGASRVAAVAAATEEVLNRVIDRAITPDTGLLDFVEDAVALLPDLVSAEADGSSFDVDEMVARGQHLIHAEAPEETPLAPRAEPGTAKVIPWPTTPSAESKPSVEEPIELAEWTSEAQEPASPPSALITDRESTLASDEELLEIFRAETEEHLSALTDFLTAARKGDRVPGEAVVRSLHTLTGSARMAGIETVGAVTKPLEARTRSYQSAAEPIPDDLLALLERATNGISARVAELPTSGAGARELGELAQGLASLPEVGEPEPAPIRAAQPTTVQEPGPEEVIATAIGGGEEEPVESAEETAPDLSLELERAFAEARAQIAGTTEAGEIAPPEEAEATREATTEPEWAAGTVEVEPIAEIEAIEPTPIVEPEEAPATATAIEEAEPIPEVAEAIEELVPTVEIEAISEAIEELAPVAEIESIAEAAEPAPAEELEPVPEAAEPTGMEASIEVEAPTEAPAPIPIPTSEIPALAASLTAIQPGDFQEPPDDPELVEIFLEDARDLLDSLDERIRQWQLTPSDFSGLAEINRMLHTLKGSARLTNLPAIGDLSHALETRLGNIDTTGPGPDALTLELTQRTTDALANQIDAAEQGQPIPRMSALVQVLNQKPEAPISSPIQLPTPLPEPVLEAAEDFEEPPADREMVEIFLEDARDLLDGLDTRIQEWQRAPGDGSGLSEVNRMLHTLKGSARLASLPAIGDLSHALETRLGSDPAAVDQPTLELAQRTVDMLANQVDAAEQGQPIPRASALLATLGQTAERPIAPPIQVPSALPEAVADSEDVSAPPADRELVEIFLEDARDLLDGLDTRMHEWQGAPGGGAGLAEINRMLHTLKGSARLASLPAIGDLSHALETRLGSDPAAVDQPTLELAQRAVDMLTHQVDAAEQGQPIPRATPLLATLGGAAERPIAPPIQVPSTLPEAVVDAGDVQELPDDRELVGIFLEDARDLLDGLDAKVREWQLAPQDTSGLADINRMLHTLKGSARLANLPAVGDLSHALETRLTSVSGGKGGGDDLTMELTQRALDMLSLQVDALEQETAVPRGSALVAALSQPPEPRAAPEEAAASVAVMRPAAGAKPAEAPPSFSAMVSGQGAPATPAAPQIRVRADLLNTLVDNSGEIGLYRARLSQRNGQLGFSLGELDQTVARLRDRLRLLEIETEKQIRHRFEREGFETEDASMFDALELDRFSTLQQLSRSLAETVNDLVSLKELLAGYQRETADLLTQQARLADDLQDGLLRSRMVPFVQVVPRLHRLVRQTADSTGKRARLEVIGPEVELDRMILDRLVAPLEHLLRNAVDHGLEAPDARTAAGKSATGLVTLALSREGNDVVIELSDDGRGLDLSAIRRKAISRGLLAEDAEVSDDVLMQMVFQRGFSTHEGVTQISGRGVGLDVVTSEIKAANGTISLDSIHGGGTNFTIRLPLTLAIIEAFLVNAGENIYAIPHTTVEGAARISREDLAAIYHGDGEGFIYRGNHYRVVYLGGVLNERQEPELGERRWLPLLLSRVGEQRVALQVDSIIESQRIVVKPLGPQLAGVRWLSGGTILPDGRIALILDALALLRSGTLRDYAPTRPTEEVPSEAPICVMVVDDSITVRRVTSRLLKRQNMEVLTAKDGVEALTLLDERMPDVMLLDIEMPRMDGYELTRHVRRSERLRELPIIMITSRAGEKHRDHALSLGVDRYLGKPYQETELLTEIGSVLEERSK